MTEILYVLVGAAVIAVPVGICFIPQVRNLLSIFFEYLLRIGDWLDRNGIPFAAALFVVAVCYILCFAVGEYVVKLIIDVTT